MKVKSIRECSTVSILQYFWPALSDNKSWKPTFLRVAVLHRLYCISNLIKHAISLKKNTNASC